MSNRLNFSSIDDAWGIPKNQRKEEDEIDPGKKFNYKKPVDNTLAINNNEITELKQEIQKLKLSQELKMNEVEHFNQKTIKFNFEIFILRKRFFEFCVASSKRPSPDQTVTNAA